MQIYVIKHHTYATDAANNIFRKYMIQAANKLYIDIC